MLADEQVEHATAQSAADDVLNDVRSLRAMHTGMPCTKSEGASWAVTNLPVRWQPAIQAALAIRRRAGTAHDQQRVLQERALLHAAILDRLQEL
jgi:hypothetical protein